MKDGRESQVQIVEEKEYCIHVSKEYECDLARILVSEEKVQRIVSYSQKFLIGFKKSL